MPRPALIAMATALLLAAACVLAWRLETHARLRVITAHTTFAADGREHTLATLAPPRWHTLHPEDVLLSGATARVDAHGALYIQAPVNATRESLRLTWHNRTTTLPVVFTADTQPSPQQPGLPDWMPLHSAADRANFRRWFTGLAERAADAPAADLPAEIADCAALLRYSFRESLRAHDDRWYAAAPALERLTVPSVAQWSYPNTPLAAGLFRTRSGTFAPSDATDGAFAQFADAKTLIAANTFSIGRDLRRARAGDLIFYRLLELDSHHHSQYHSMIVTGAHAEWVVYHTGPINTPDGKQTRGGMRRVLLSDLLRHPDPRWRPEPHNPNFLGIYRWSLLAEDN